MALVSLPIDASTRNSGIHNDETKFIAGDTGSNLIEWIRFLLGKDMQFPHIKVVIPTAPVQPYTPLGGEVRLKYMHHYLLNISESIILSLSFCQLSHVWFDRHEISITSRECRKSLGAIYQNVNDLIRVELDLGIPANRIIVGECPWTATLIFDYMFVYCMLFFFLVTFRSGGFSMGGALSLHTAYHINRELAGVFACSSFLNNDSIVYESLRNAPSNATWPKLLMFHGDRDSLVPSEWGRKTFDQLRSLGVQGDFVVLKNTMHELKIKEMVELQQWITDKLPPLEQDLPNKL